MGSPNVWQGLQEGVEGRGRVAEQGEGLQRHGAVCTSGNCRRELRQRIDERTLVGRRGHLIVEWKGVRRGQSLTKEGIQDKALHRCKLDVNSGCDADLCGCTSSPLASNRCTSWRSDHSRASLPARSCPTQWTRKGINSQAQAHWYNRSFIYTKTCFHYVTAPDLPT